MADVPYRPRLTQVAGSALLAQARVDVFAAGDPSEFHVGIPCGAGAYISCGIFADYRRAMEVAIDRSQRLGGIPVCDFTALGGDAA